MLHTLTSARKLLCRWRAVAMLACFVGCAAVAARAQGASQTDKSSGPPAEMAPVTPAEKAAAADAAWNQLVNTAKPSKERGATTDWNTIADSAKDFRTKYPEHPQSRTAAKIELVTTIRAEDSKTELSASTVLGTTTFLSDHANAVRDRLELKIAFEQAKLRRQSYASRAERMQADAAHARELIAGFPDQPEGYGYQLALAKAESPTNARQLAEQLIGSSATPAAFKTGAQRVLARLALEGQPLKLDAAKAAIAAAKEFSLVVYSWSKKDTGFLDVIRRLAIREDVRFIGVNLDEDAKGAQAMAADLRLPGTQIYDGKGFDGPAASQLCLTMSASLYIVDFHGAVRFVNGHQDPFSKLTQLALEKGFKP